ncbi:MAG: hypothetical protein ACXV2D_07170 [Halobacteriota archaeon]
MDTHSAGTDQKERRDKFFCRLAMLCFEGGLGDKDGWVLIPKAASITGCSEGKIEYFLERLTEDGWIEVDGPGRAGGKHARLTSVGRARAQVICKDAPFAR